MPDWKRQVRRRLHLPPLRNQRAERIVEELAGQLDDLYVEARRHGASSREGTRAAFAQVENWNELSERIAEAERPNRVSPAEQRFEDALAEQPCGGPLRRLFGGIALDARISLRRLAASRTSTAIAVGVLSLAIAAAGVYGVLAHSVAQRTREIGIRMALGATPGGIVRTVLGRALVLLGAGLAIGLGGAWQFGAGVKGFLFMTEPGDPLVFGAVLLGLAAAGILAGVAPARRASRVDPMVTLRSE